MTMHDGERFHNQTLELDGQTFRRCHFINCQIRFRGIAPFGFEGNRYEGSFWIHLLEEWRKMEDALDPLRRELNRYGTDLDEVLRPERPATGWSPAVMPEQREMHIQYMFRRDGKPGDGLRLTEPEREGT
ncbi:MAG TPA: hypothetical protein VKZ61_04095 [Thermomicrobiales bacterium]|jgi:hypothetical protein|nr:hypothetical protein [Thermomicrobiales bacterium]